MADVFASQKNLARAEEYYRLAVKRIEGRRASRRWRGSTSGTENPTGNSVLKMRLAVLRKEQWDKEFIVRRFAAILCSGVGGSNPAPARLINNLGSIPLASKPLCTVDYT
jgi:hypothetical protein